MTVHTQGKHWTELWIFRKRLAEIEFRERQKSHIGEITVENIHYLSIFSPGDVFRVNAAEQRCSCLEQLLIVTVGEVGNTAMCFGYKIGSVNACSSHMCVSMWEQIHEGQRRARRLHSVLGNFWNEIRSRVISPTLFTAYRFTADSFLKIKFPLGKKK